MSDLEEFRGELERKVRGEARAGWENARKRWAKPLQARIESGRAIGRLEVSSEEIRNGVRWVFFDPSSDDMALFGEGQDVRMSRNDPDGDHVRARFYGLKEKGLCVSVPMDANLSQRSGWSLDEEMIDLTEFYLAALAELATTRHGRETVLPALIDGAGDEVDFEAHEEFAEEIKDCGLDDSQIDGVAACLAADRFHLVQGPPGTGKTQTLARLVAEFVSRGQRVLLSSFTHRAIHHALRKIAPMVDCPVFKISAPFPGDDQGFVIKGGFAETGLLDHSGPYVIGATPFALFSSRAREARFDVAVIDETSQMRVESAIMPMLRAERWFFFGDRQQLPPVSQRPNADAAADSVFAALSRNGGHTLLRTTYRMNKPLTLWPSENFYGGELVAAKSNAAHRFTLKSPAISPLLGTDPSLVRVEIDHEGNRAFSLEEADETASLIEQMLAGGLPPSEIGVVVPFRAQAAKVRALLRFERFAKWPEIRSLAVDTVERFQGQEREAMIVSFVASEDAFIDRLADFLTYPQRLNVAVTRARTKVVLIHSLRFRQWLERNAPHHESARLALSLLNAADV